MRWLATVAVAVTASAFAAAGASAQPGDLDRSFSDDGRLAVGADHLAFTRGGRLITLVGDRLQRITRSGRIDHSYGTVPPGGDMYAATLAVDGSGRAIVVRTGLDKVVVTRATASGKPDRSFGASGTALLAKAGWPAQNVLLSGSHMAVAITRVTGSNSERLVFTKLDGRGRRVGAVRVGSSGGRLTSSALLLGNPATPVGLVGSYQGTTLIRPDSSPQHLAKALWYPVSVGSGFAAVERGPSATAEPGPDRAGSGDIEAISLRRPDLTVRWRHAWREALGQDLVSDRRGGVFVLAYLARSASGPVSLSVRHIRRNGRLDTAFGHHGVATVALTGMTRNVWLTDARVSPDGRRLVAAITERVAREDLGGPEMATLVALKAR